MTQDQTIEYGDDFYLAVNNKWLQDPANAIPAGYSKWGGFVKLADDGRKKQIELVKNLRSKSDKTSEESKILAVWEASERRFESWRNATANYDAVLTALNALNAFFINSDSDFASRIAECLHHTSVNGLNNVLNFGTESDLVNSNNSVLNLSPSGLSLPGRDYYFDDNFKSKRELYKKHLENVRAIINPFFKLDENFVDNVLSFETNLAKFTMTDEQARYYSDYYTNTTLTDLYENIDSLKFYSKKLENYDNNEKEFVLSNNQRELIKTFFEKLYDLFNFRDVLKNNRDKNFIQKNIQNPPHIEHIVAYDGDGIRRILAFILDESNVNRYRSYLQYNIICSLNSFCTKELNDEIFDFYSRNLTGQAEQKSEDLRSINLVNNYAGEMLGKLYVAEYFPEKHKHDIKNIINTILEVMKDSLQKNDWLTETTKNKALLKLSKFTVKVGYPDVWKDYNDLDINVTDSLYDIFLKVKKWSLQREFYDKINAVVDKTEWHMDPQTVNAYFSPTHNEIVFPAGILQPPFYNKSIQDLDFDIDEELKSTINHSNFVLSANLGGIGAVIAHEITHGYDDKGKKFDGDGNLNNWWTDDDALLFKNKTDLMAEQASQCNFVVDGAKYTLNAGLTMGENLADLGGISLVLQASNKRDYVDSNESRANTRVLFKSFANIWKRNIKDDTKIIQITTDPHSLADFRANLVKNIDEFYEAFDIKETDKMYIPRSKRVRMW